MKFRQESGKELKETRSSHETEIDLPILKNTKINFSQSSYSFF